MRTRIALLLTVLIVAMTGATAVSPAAVARVDKDCSEFANQAAAQKFFIDNGGPQDDPHRLDEDGDGVACEANPCPCSTNTGGGGGGGPSTPPVKRQKVTIVRVLDGDTVTVKFTSGPRKAVRLLGIDTPETKPKQCGARKAKENLRDLLSPGLKVELVSDPTQPLKDRYSRLLRYVMKRNSDASLRQLRAGTAKVYMPGKPVQRAGKYRAAQTRAKNQNRGLWQTCW